LPAAEEDHLIRHLLGFETVRLFVERASAADPGFALTAGNGPAIARICQRLDGNPLAIELAAARTRVLLPEQIATRLDDRFQLLTGGSRTALPRQQSLRATLDWSHDLLSPAEQTLLRRLAVFPGRWSLAAAERVCAFNGVEGGEMLDLVGGLVDKSLVLVDDEAGSHVGRGFRLLETVREYAAERLAAAGETVVARDRHRDWFLEDELGLLDWRETAVSPTVLAGLRRTHRDVGLDNVRAAVAWCQTRSVGPGADDARLAWLLLAQFSFWHWYVQGNYSEGLAALDGALEASAPTSEEASPGPGLATLRALVMCTLSVLAMRVHDVARAVARSCEGEAIARAAGDDWALCQTLGAGGEAVQGSGDFERARAMFAESLQIAESHEFGRLATFARFRLGRLACLQSDPAADELLDRAVTLARQEDDAVSVILALVWHARAALVAGDVERAARLAGEGIDLARTQGFRRGVMLGEEHAGQIALAGGDRDRALAHFVEALRIGLEIGEREGFGACLEGFASSVNPARPADLIVVARLLGAVAAQRESMVSSRRSVRAQTREDAADAACRGLGQAAFDAELAAGRAMPIEQAVDLALRTVAREARPASEVQRPPDSQPPLLTPRERQVAALVTRGLTNRQIAADLTISERTADGHVASILSKLDFTNRAQIAAWSARQESEAASTS
jgi:predicted ATPase/DNA-binding NarL/FixJ family response regulator